jgi:hypothetical protein
MSSPTTVVRIDVSGTAFRGSPTWTDYTSSVMNDPGVTTTWGRQDEQGDPPPRTCTFLLKNDTGAFTPGSGTAPAGWKRGARVNVRVTVAATTYDRFDGYVDSIEATWPGGVQSWSVVKVTCTDITARLAAGVKLLSMVEQEMLADAPTYLYPLDESSSSVSAGDISGNSNRAAYRSDGKYGAGSVAFASDMGLADPTTGVAFSSTDTPGLQPGKLSVLSISNNDGGPVAPSAGAFTCECWVVLPDTRPDAASFSTEFILKHSGGPFSDGRTHGVWLTWSYDGTIHFSTIDGVNNAAGVSSPLAAGLHHIVGTVAADLKTVKLYIDGALVDTGVGPAAVDLTGLTRNHIGGNLSTTSTQIGGQFQGTIGLVALYPTVLSAARILTHYQAGVGTLTELSGARYARLAGYGAVPTSGLPTGQATMGHQNTRGVNLTDALQKVARTEGTVSYATGAGALTFQARDTRYDPATLVLTAADVDGDVTFRFDGQGFANGYTVSRDGGASQRVDDATSQAALGQIDGQPIDVAPSGDFDALQNAAWQLGLSNRSAARTPSVTVNLLKATSALAGQVLTADVSTLVTVSGLPAQAPASSVSLFIEGGSEVIALNNWSVQFFTSPSLPFTTLRADGSASSRTKLDTGLKIPF